MQLSTGLIPDVENHPSVEDEFGSFEIPPDNIAPNYEVHPVEFELIMSSLQRGKEKLVDSRGFTYTIKRKCNNVNVFWRCTVRYKTANCLATLQQQQTAFTLVPHKHCHQPVPGAGIAARVSRDVKAKAMENYFQSEEAIVEQVHPNC